MVQPLFSASIPTWYSLVPTYLCILELLSEIPRPQGQAHSDGLRCIWVLKNTGNNCTAVSCMVHGSLRGTGIMRLKRRVLAMYWVSHRCCFFHDSLTFGSLSEREIPELVTLRGLGARAQRPARDLSNDLYAVFVTPKNAVYFLAYLCGRHLSKAAASSGLIKDWIPAL